WAKGNCGAKELHGRTPQHYVNILCWQGKATMSTQNVDSVLPGQCRGARGLLGMTQPQLAHKAGLGLSTVVDFERSRRVVSKAAIEKIHHALKVAGIEFIPENGGGPGVRLRKKR